MQTFIIGYDISGNRARRRAMKALEAYGTRVQRSVFEIHVRGEAQLRDLLARLREELAEEEGADLRAWRLTEEGRRQSATLSGEPLSPLPAVIIL
ncbi:CRISPR-associated protein Cas2 [Thioalkalivibrio sulfidiphilus HL-EbGr7]|uniref:CRISPR-associated endoribonuclease Cas2 n=1 Tax=Thioalkalivibrio sulfidiphilus (strain HL-EbGR7) TaxID=396588 RepID=B8GSH9_THISH|nr:CRISPR-associated endonuclease Cas2 [Thioalkalivibrio sulfidiphilus]ACL72883.1 CRISPR-associated protein Cas2 [Thioalkalivibrio sulfidiphilus HL-EbGr7]